VIGVRELIEILVQEEGYESLKVANPRSFLHRAIQFTTTVSGVSVVSPRRVFTRKRLPSAATA
jgi:hypothetical protein